MDPVHTNTPRFLRTLSGLLPMALLLLTLPAAPAHAAGGAPEPQIEIPRSPEQIAAQHYNQGLQFRNRAAKLEGRLEREPDPARQAKLRKRIENFYRDAIQELQVAVTHNPGMHQAYSSLGYALRKVGDYEASLAAYDRALKLAPTYSEAIEYRAEAYLHLGRLEDAKAGYMTLFNQDRPLADQLLGAMERWVEVQRAEDAEGGEPGAAARGAEELARWIAQRREIGAHTPDVHGGDTAGRGSQPGRW